MFIGHFALGFAAKKAAPRTSLATLFVAAQLADILWPIFLAFGLEQVLIVPGKTPVTPFDFVSYPLSHSLLMLAVWGALFAGVYFYRKRDSRAAWIIFALVLSHWALDWITHIPDMPVWPGGPVLGLGMWQSLPLTLVVELALYAAGVAIYARSTRARDRQGVIGFSVLVFLLLAAYVWSDFSAPPPSVQALWMTAMLGSIVTLVLAWWADRHRESVVRSTSAVGS